MENNIIKLNKEEISIIKTYQELIEKQNTSLGSLRRQCLMSEKKILDAIVSAENDLYSHIKILAQSKEIPMDESWIFDPKLFAFVKRE